ncbi:hypothetical protein TI03_06710, partial [Achromatium sp. WMS1]
MAAKTWACCARLCNQDVGTSDWRAYHFIKFTKRSDNGYGSQPLPVCGGLSSIQRVINLVCQLHRPVNVDQEQKLGEMLNAITSGCHGLPVVFPVHPRTAKT